MARIVEEVFPRVNQMDGFGGHIEGVGEAFQGGGVWLQVLDGLQLHFVPTEFRGGVGLSGNALLPCR